MNAPLRDYVVTVSWPSGGPGRPSLAGGRSTVAVKAANVAGARDAAKRLVGAPAFAKASVHGVNR